MALLPGDVAPRFRCASSVNPQFNFDTAAGRYIVLSFLGSTKVPAARRLLDRMAALGDRFDVTHAIFFGVTSDATTPSGSPTTTRAASTSTTPT